MAKGVPTLLADSNAFVIDFGSSNVSWGYAGDDLPRQVTSNVWSHYTKEDGTAAWATEPTNFCELREGYEPHRTATYGQLPPILRKYGAYKSEITPELSGRELQGLVSKKLVQKHLQRISKFFPGDESLADRAVLITAPTKKGPLYSDVLAEILFEKIGAGALFNARKAPLIALSLGRPTALVVETGPVSTTFSPVLEGYSLYKSVKEHCVGGLFTEMMLASSLKLYNPVAGQFSDSLMPFGCRDSDIEENQTEVVALRNVHDTYVHMARVRVIEDLIASTIHARVPVQPSTTNAMEDDESGDGSTYELPDGKLIHVPRSVANDVVEYIFHPENVSEIHTLLRSCREELSPSITSWPGLVKGICSAAFHCDVDLVPGLLSNIAVGGGPSSMPEYVERLGSEFDQLSQVDLTVRDNLSSEDSNVNPPEAGMTKNLKAIKPRVASAVVPHRQFSSWQGGSILTSLSSFNRLWVAKSEWHEYGARILNSRFVL